MCVVDIDRQSALLSMSSPDDTCFVVDQDLSIPGMGGYYLNDLHGLMCFTLRNKACCIYNPTTGQCFTLPKIKPKIITEPGQLRCVNRNYIGYDPIDNQHKLLCTIVIYSNNLANLKTEHWVLVLEAEGFWKKVVPHGNYRPHAPFIPGKCISGSVVHYLAWHTMYNYAIVSFDFRSEEFTTIIVPVEDFRYDLPAVQMRAELIEYSGKIAIFEFSFLKTEGSSVLRVLEDAEKKEWSTRSLILQPSQMHLVQDIELGVKGTTQDGKVNLAPWNLHSGLYILRYDLQSNVLTKVEIKGIPQRWFDKECYYFDLRLVNEISGIYE